MIRLSNNRLIETILDKESINKKKSCALLLILLLLLVLVLFFIQYYSSILRHKQNVIRKFLWYFMELISSLFLSYSPSWVRFLTFSWLPNRLLPFLSDIFIGWLPFSVGGKYFVITIAYSFVFFLHPSPGGQSFNSAFFVLGECFLIQSLFYFILVLFFM